MAHAWKVCRRQRLEGSNPSLSATCPHLSHCYCLISKHASPNISSTSTRIAPGFVGMWRHQLAPARASGLRCGAVLIKPEQAGEDFVVGQVAGAEVAPVPFGRGIGNHAAPLFAALQPAACAISFGQHDAVADDERLAQSQAGLATSPYHAWPCRSPAAVLGFQSHKLPPQSQDLPFPSANAVTAARDPGQPPFADRGHGPVRPACGFSRE